ncbi:hypothetical protein A9Q84_11595 [Halobacteriovorax marinus]|uniref:Methyl-accepting transducer domain-containing protein n=1 Tax=Halobacteriovorax marinus TaxID=97084 RepID=A0A1Y5FEE9_9BACT|nr:hypothetical protein A9Q84_11595 [Halobacteriovorax marinus]
MKLNIGQKILYIVVIPFVLFSVVFLYSSYTETSENLMREKKLSLEYVIQTAMTVVTNHQKRVDSGELSEEKAKKLASIAIGNIRYGRDMSDYLWVNSLHPRMVAHPKKSLIGKDLSNFKDKAGQKIFMNMINIAKKDGKGFIEYVWSDKVDKDKFVPKLSYVLYNERWEWILGTGIYINDVNTTITKLLIGNFIKIAIIMTILIFAVGFVIKKNIREPLLEIASQLYNTSESVTSGASASLENCDLLAESSQEQAASLQQTVSAVEEISAMISRNAKSAEASKITSLESQKSANIGKKRVDEMLLTIDEISNNNENVIDSMKNTNEEVSEILNIVRDINEKTKVINDIVFQTKLLSFNASVEAARAGEAGKGFTVVAEEIGALANMSGKASDEIRSLIENSISKVETIVSTTTSVMNKMIEEGNLAVNSGKERAQECKIVLDEIISNVDNVNTKVGEISNASHEQATGVEEISKAMELLDQVSNVNNNIVINTASSSRELQSEAHELIEVVDKVKGMVHGAKAS